jgi:hypothetical protein
MLNNSLVNHTVQLRREPFYNYFWVDSSHLFQYSAHLVLPGASYIYSASIRGRVIDIVQVPVGVATTEFLLYHSDSVVEHLWGALGR